jgi:hypothetical protein
LIPTIRSTPSTVISSRGTITTIPQQQQQPHPVPATSVKPSTLEVGNIIIPNVRPISKINHLPRIVQRQSHITTTNSIDELLEQPPPSEKQMIDGIHTTGSTSVPRIAAVFNPPSIVTGNNPYHPNRNPNPAAQWIPRPNQNNVVSTNDGTTSMTATTDPNYNPSTKKTKKSKGGNFVRLNLRNKNGSCQQTNGKGSGGHKKYSTKNAQSQSWWEQRKKDRKEHEHAMRLQEVEDAKDRTTAATATMTTGGTAATPKTTTAAAWHLIPESMLLPLLTSSQNTSKGNIMTSALTNSTNGIDIIDDFMDGMYRPDDDTTGGTMDSQPPPPKTTTTTNNAPRRRRTKTKMNSAAAVIPLCSGHQQPCKLCTVNKSGPNRGRKFYVCATASRMDQCSTFIWVDDTTKVRFVM